MYAGFDKRLLFIRATASAALANLLRSDQDEFEAAADERERRYDAEMYGRPYVPNTQPSTSAAAAARDAAASSSVEDEQELRAQLLESMLLRQQAENRRLRSLLSQPSSQPANPTSSSIGLLRRGFRALSVEEAPVISEPSSPVVSERPRKRVNVVSEDDEDEEPARSQDATDDEVVFICAFVSPTKRVKQERPNNQ
jgi:hypothetical protein